MYNLQILPGDVLAYWFCILFFFFQGVLSFLFFLVSHNQIIWCLTPCIKIWNHCSVYIREGKFTFQRGGKCAFLFTFTSLPVTNTRLHWTTCPTWRSQWKCFNTTNLEAKGKRKVLCWCLAIKSCSTLRSWIWRSSSFAWALGYPSVRIKLPDY